MVDVNSSPFLPLRFFHSTLHIPTRHWMPSFSSASNLGCEFAGWCDARSESSAFTLTDSSVDGPSDSQPRIGRVSRFNRFCYSVWQGDMGVSNRYLRRMFPIWPTLPRGCSMVISMKNEPVAGAGRAQRLEIVAVAVNISVLRRLTLSRSQR